MNIELAVALVIAAALIAASIAVSHRYDLRAHVAGKCTDSSIYPCDRAWLVDQWTGRMQICEFGSSADGLYPVCWYARGATSLP
jgi:hypothetical protein